MCQIQCLLWFAAEETRELRQSIEQQAQVKQEKVPGAPTAEGNETSRVIPTSLQPKSQGGGGAVECIEIDGGPPKKQLRRSGSSSAGDSKPFKQFQNESGWKPRRSASAVAK